MNGRTIIVCPHVLSGRTSSMRIFRVAPPTATDCGFHVTCGRSIEEALTIFDEEAFLQRYPGIREVMSTMPVETVCVLEETADGTCWKQE